MQNTAGNGVGCPWVFMLLILLVSVSCALVGIIRMAAAPGNNHRFHELEEVVAQQYASSVIATAYYFPARASSQGIVNGHADAVVDLTYRAISEEKVNSL